MYGVFCITPPQRPAAIVATPSVNKMSLARYSSPATMADSVLSVPPITVARENGMASGKYGLTARHVSAHARVGQGIARARPGSSVVGPGHEPPSARSQKI